MEAATAEAPPWLCSRAGQDPEVLRAPGTVTVPLRSQPKASPSRFQLIFRWFFRAFARPEHPLALFLDDLQWLEQRRSIYSRT
jgi:hypothetical protein